MEYMDVVKWWQSKGLKTAADFSAALDNFQIMFTCNSNNIEGDNLSYYTTREIYEDAPLTSTGLLPRQIFEVRNQKFAFGSVVKCLEKRIPLSVDLIKRLHRLMMNGTYDNVRWEKGERPGEFKVGDYCVGMTDEGTPPEYVEEDLIDLVDEVNSTSGDPITIAAYFHARFESIHPFTDGNGRLGRTLLNYYLMLNDYPPMIIYNEDKNTYYLGLEVYDRTEELKGLIAFLKEQTIKTWDNRIAPKKYTQKQIEFARKYAPEAYDNLSDDELWELVGKYIVNSVQPE